MVTLLESEEFNGQTCLRDELVNIALRWQEKFGVAPFITPTISEYDAAMLVGMSQSEYSACMRNRTAVSRGWDFEHKGKRYQVKACRPSGKPGSKISTVPGAGDNKNWDFIICILYDRYYVMLEAWQLPLDQYMHQFGEKKNLSPAAYRTGKDIFLGRIDTMSNNNLHEPRDATTINNENVVSEDAVGAHYESALPGLSMIKNESKKDFTKYVFDGITYGKGKLVLALVKKWVSLHRPRSFQDLLTAFPQKLRSGGIFTTLDDAKSIRKKTHHKMRYFLDDPIFFPDSSEVVVSNGWDKDNIVPLLSRARELGFLVSVANGVPSD